MVGEEVWSHSSEHEVLQCYFTPGNCRQKLCSLYPAEIEGRIFRRFLVVLLFFGCKEVKGLQRWPVLLILREVFTYSSFLETSPQTHLDACFTNLLGRRRVTHVESQEDLAQRSTTT